MMVSDDYIFTQGQEAEDSGFSSYGDGEMSERTDDRGVEQVVDHVDIQMEMEYILFHLRRRDGYASIEEIASDLRTEPNEIVSTITRLESRGFLVVIEDGNDLILKTRERANGHVK